MIPPIRDWKTGEYTWPNETDRFVLDIGERRAPHNQFPITMISNGSIWPRISYNMYWQAVAIWDEWVRTLPFIHGIEFNQYESQPHNMIFLKEPVDIGILVLAFDSDIVDPLKK